jgi:pimeloyl-ACP methyl ester carboxylesterase
MKLPGREISVRQNDKHGGLRPHVKPPGTDPSGRPLVIILIHGYNNNYNQALKSYEAFQNKFSKIGMSKPYMENIWEFYWPGDGTELGVAALSYSFQIPKAQASAEKLFQYIDKICSVSSTTEFVFIAHSLGCRVLLEMLKLLKARAGQIRLAALMAAAVPRFMIEQGTLALPFIHSITGLFSPNDNTLRIFFPPGQSLARGDEGLFPEAVGLHGQPSSFWTKESLNTGLDHSKYWSEQKTANFIARQLGFATSWTTPKHSTPVHQVGL